jgi:thiamine kinase-like enzyme
MSQLLDIEQGSTLADYLRDHGYLSGGRVVRSTLLKGGVSNRVMLVQFSDGEAWVVKQALEKLRVERDWFSDQRRIHREAMALRWAARLLPQEAVPKFVFEDHEHHLLAMQAVAQPHENWKTILMRGEINLDHFAHFAHLLRCWHQGARLFRDELLKDFEDTQYFESLRLEPYYAFAASQILASRKFIGNLIEQTRACRTSLVHGDFSPKNVLLRQNQLTLLDYEVAHWGDPAFDVGFSLTHFISKAHWLERYRAQFIRAARHYWAAYAELSFEPQAVRHTLGCLLARVAGRSPLEYLDKAARARQLQIVLRLMDSPPETIEELLQRFFACL